MHCLSLALLVALPGQQMDRSLDDVDDAELSPFQPSCTLEPDLFDPAATFTTGPVAPEGGSWWLRRHTVDPGRDQLLNEPGLVLRAPDRTELAPQLHVTHGVVSIAVPAERGEALYTLTSVATDEALVLIVDGEAPSPTAGALIDIAQGPPLPDDDCTARCVDEGFIQLAARQPTVRVVYEGGPFVLDAWADRRGTPTRTLADERLVDSRLLPAHPDGLATESVEVIGAPLEGDVTLAWRVQLRDPRSQQLVHDASWTEPLSQVAFTGSGDEPLCADMPACSDEGCGIWVPACSHYQVTTTDGPGVGALMLLAVVGAGRRRRQDRHPADQG